MGDRVDSCFVCMNDKATRYCIVGNSQVMYIFAYFRHMEIVRKFEHMKIEIPHYEIARFLLTRQPFVYCGVPDVLVNVVALYHGLDDERSMSQKV